MVKKVREYKSGDFIFAKVKGYPAWPARVQRMNGKKYFVYFYGTGETANLPPNMIFDYAENKDKFLTKTVKRRDFNDGVKQIEHDFANNVPLEQVIGINPEVAVEPANETANDSAINETMDDTAVDTTAADDTVIDESVANTTQNETAVDDSDDTGALVIDEGKPKGKKSKAEAKVPAKETPAKPVKEPKTPRGKAKKEEPKKEDEEEEKKEDEIVSRSGRKIRPKRYIDEQTEENATLPSPAPKKRRGASPASDKDKEVQKEKEKPDTNEKDKNIKHFTAVTQSELEDLKEPFKSDSTSLLDTKCTEKHSNIQKDTVKSVPKFGRQKMVTDVGVKMAKNKIKKFVPPTKKINKENDTGVNGARYHIKEVDEIISNNSIQSDLHVSDRIDRYLNQINNAFGEITNDGYAEVNNACWMDFGPIDQCLNQNLSMDIENYPRHRINDRNEVEVSKSNSLGGIILGSLNVLNDDDLIPTENVVTEAISDNLSVKNLAQSRAQSSCSVASLKKVYKNLDSNSFEDNRIPELGQLSNLFNESKPKCLEKPVVMSIRNGDMGFNLKYSDHMKTVPCRDTEFTSEENETALKILRMYPNENGRYKNKFELKK